MSENSQDFFINLDWNETTEELLVSWADIAMCYTWIYEKTYRRLSSLNFKFSIPIIILSTLTGTLGIGLSSLVPSDYVQTGQNIIGAVNIFTGIITTLQNFFRYAQQSELALTATTDWSKFYRNIKIELSIERHNRKPATEFVRGIRQEYERLLNTRPIIPRDIIKDFYKEFESSDVIKPEVLDKVQHLIIYDDTNTVNYYRSAKEQAEKAISKKITSSPSLLRKFTNKISYPYFRSRPDKESKDENDFSSQDSSPSFLNYKKNLSIGRDSPIQENISFEASIKEVNQRDIVPKEVNQRDLFYTRFEKSDKLFNQIQENSKQLEDIKEKYFKNEIKDQEEGIELEELKIHLEDDVKV
jgi:hypothetical protein